MAHLAANRETDVEDFYGRGDIRVILDIDDEDVVYGRPHNSGEGTHKEFVERGEEACMVYVIQSHGQTVVQHILGYQSHKQLTCRLHLVDSIYNKSNTASETRLLINEIVEMLLFAMALTQLSA